MNFTQEQLLYASSHLLDEFAAEIGMSREPDESDPSFRVRIKAVAFPTSEDEALKEYFGAIEAGQSAVFTVTLRDYFAAKAMQGFLSGPMNRVKFEGVADVARISYVMADAMLAVRGESK